MKRVLIDFTQIPIKKVGVGVYAKETFTRIFKQKASGVKYYALIQNDEHMFDSFENDNVKLLKVNAKYFRKFLLRFLVEQFYIPFLLLKYKIDVVHSLHYSFPLLNFGRKRIVTIHDMTFFIYPQLHTLVKRYYFKLFIRLATRMNNCLVCVSKSTETDLKQYAGNFKGKSVVVPLAVSVPDIDKQVELKVFEKFRINNDYIVFIGTLEPRKNIDSIISAYSKIKKELTDIRLLVIGKKGWYYDSIFKKIADLGIKDDIIITGFVSEEEKWVLLKNAKLFVYPSFYEGFGLPVLEAMSIGVPTITSNISSMPEVAGKGALLVNPQNEQELVEAMKKALTDMDLYLRLQEEGIIQAKKFTWERTAAQTICIYKD